MPQAWLDELVDARHALRVRIAGEERNVAIEDAGRLRDALGTALPVGVPEVFTEAVEVTGVVLTKLDGTAKGGIVVAVQRELGIPVKLVGLGEGPDDLAPFEPEAFAEALVGNV